MLFAMPLHDPEWKKFRAELLAHARAGDHEWLDTEEIRAVLAEAWRKGLAPSLIISCRAAAASQLEFTRCLNEIVEAAKTRLLIIDDEKPLTSLLKLNLEKTGRFTVTAENEPTRWREALRAAQPRLLVLDMVMPGCDGREILDQLRAAPETATLPVIVLTALLQDSDTEAINRSGVLFLSKPVSLKALLHCIDELLGGGSARG